MQLLPLLLLSAPHVIWQTGFELPPPEYKGTADPPPECWSPGLTGCNWLQMSSWSRKNYVPSCDQSAPIGWCYQSAVKRSGNQAYMAWVNAPIQITVSDVQRAYIMGDQFRTTTFVDLPGPFVHSYYVKIDGVDLATWSNDANGRPAWAVLWSYSAHAFNEANPALWSTTILNSGVVGQWGGVMPMADRPKFPLGRWVRVTTAWANTDDPRAVRTWVDGGLSNYGPYPFFGQSKGGDNLGAFHPGSYTRNDVPKINYVYDDVTLWSLSDDGPWVSDEEPPFAAGESQHPVTPDEAPAEPSPVPTETEVVVTEQPTSPQSSPTTSSTPGPLPLQLPTSTLSCPGVVECSCVP